ncbi:MAG: energy-coupling factor ABC transporter permease [Spirochaetes bacterium]|nr:energy-coupling factor ABC transporter permease [Spirochaetota bacterium]
MHIPDHMISAPACTATAAVSFIGLVFAVSAAVITRHKPETLRFASVTALIFAAQMMNYPVQNGTSGHLIGTALAVALLGIPFGIISVSLVIAIQCFIFADGGISALGANILNMSLIAAFPGIIFHLLAKNISTKKPIIFITALLSVILAATACSLELALSGAIELAEVFPAMISVHFLIGIGEAIITLSAVSIFSIDKTGLSSRKFSYTAFAVSAAITLLLSSFACSYPDGLEWVADKFGFLNSAESLLMSPFPDYSVPAVSDSFISSGLAGFSGILIIIFAAYSASVIFKNIILRHERNPNE